MAQDALLSIRDICVSDCGELANGVATTHKHCVGTSKGGESSSM